MSNRNVENVEEKAKALIQLIFVKLAKEGKSLNRRKHWMSILNQVLLINMSLNSMEKEMSIQEYQQEISK